VFLKSQQDVSSGILFYGNFITVSFDFLLFLLFPILMPIQAFLKVFFICFPSILINRSDY
jgi:hypothetical protein